MKKSIAIMLALSIFVSIFIYSSSAAGNVVYAGEADGAGNGTYLNPYPSFYTALQNVNDGGIIYIKGGESAFANALQDDGPLVIDKSITIATAPEDSEKGVLITRTSGIILGADVTFDNVDIGLASKYHNAIFANGHKLTLNSVKQYQGHRGIHIFGGGVFGNSTPAGTKGEIIISGQCKLENIYAGSMNTAYNGDVTITVNGVTGNSIGACYGASAVEAAVDRNDWFDLTEPDAPAPQFANGSVNGDVTFNITHSAGRLIDGRGCNKSTVNISASSDVRMVGTAINYIDELNIMSGVFEPSDLVYDSAPDISVSANATLDLTNIENPSANNFNGGGTVVLSLEACFEIFGVINGTTNLAVGGVYNGTSGIATKDHIYILSHTKADEDSFAYNPYISQYDYYIASDGFNWYITSDEPEALPLSSMAFTSSNYSFTEQEANNYSASLIVNAEGAEPDESFSMYDLVYTVVYNNNTYVSETNYDYYGVAEIEELGMVFSISYDDYTDENGRVFARINIEKPDFSQKDIKAGVYEITASYGEISASTVLSVNHYFENGECSYCGEKEEVISCTISNNKVMKGGYLDFSAQVKADTDYIKIVKEFTLKGGSHKTISAIYSKKSTAVSIENNKWIIHNRFTYTGYDDAVEMLCTVYYKDGTEYKAISSFSVLAGTSEDALKKHPDYDSFTIISASAPQGEHKEGYASITVVTTDDCSKVRIGNGEKYTTYQTTSKNATYTDSNGIRTWQINYKFPSEAANYTAQARGSRWGEAKEFTY